jgi:hypothetical protein
MQLWLMEKLAELLCRDRCSSGKVKRLQSCFAVADAVVADGMRAELLRCSRLQLRSLWRMQSYGAVADAVAVDA